LLAQKKEQEKGPQLCRPPEADCLALLTVAGAAKNSASPQTVLPSFSGNSCDAQRHKMGLQPKISDFCIIPKKVT